MEETKLVRVNGKAYRLPVVLPFFTGNIVKSDFHFYDVVGFRCPKAGEFYLSGAIVEVWKAPRDLSTPFLVVVKTDKAKRVQAWTKA